MPEEYTPISQARQNLPKLARDAQRRIKRYVITHQGMPEAVLLGYEDYRALKAVSQLAQRPERMASLEKGLDEARTGRTIPLEKAHQKLKRAAEDRRVAALREKRGRDRGATKAAPAGPVEVKILVDVPGTDANEAQAPAGGFKQIVSRFERDVITRVLERVRGNKTQAAKILGLARTTLIEKLKKLESAS